MTLNFMYNFVVFFYRERGIRTRMPGLINAKSYQFYNKYIK